MKYAPCKSCGTAFSTPLDDKRLCGYCAPAYRQALADAYDSVGAAGPDPCVVMCGDCRTCNEWRVYYKALAAIDALKGGTDE